MQARIWCYMMYRCCHVAIWTQSSWCTVIVMLDHRDARSSWCTILVMLDHCDARPWLRQSVLQVRACAVSRVQLTFLSWPCILMQYCLRYDALQVWCSMLEVWCICHPHAQVYGPLLLGQVVTRWNMWSDVIRRDIQGIQVHKGRNGMEIQSFKRKKECSEFSKRVPTHACVPLVLDKHEKN